MIKDYLKNNNGLISLVRTEEQIKADFSTAKYNITEKALNFLSKFSACWLDANYSSGYMLTPFKNDIIKLDSISSPTSEHAALRFNLTQTYLIDLFFRSGNVFNTIQTFIGDTGSSKSRTSLNIFYWLNEFNKEVLEEDTTFNINNVVFSRSEVVDLVPKLKPRESCQLDEDNEALLGIGSFQEWSQVNRFEKTLRSLQKNFSNLSPNLTPHNEHYILKCVGFNDRLLCNKAIIRERDGVYKGFIVIPNPKGAEYNKFIADYEAKKRQFQKDLEENKGNEARLNRLLEMSVKLILKYKLYYTMKDIFSTIINSEFKLDLKSQQELKRLMLLLLDSRIDMFKEQKQQIKEFIKPKKTEEEDKDFEKEYLGG